MQARNTILRAALGLLAIIGLLIHHPPISQAQTWTRLGEGEQDGGVVGDIQLLSSAETGDNPVVWAASMGTGLFRNSFTTKLLGSRLDRVSARQRLLWGGCHRCDLGHHHGIRVGGNR